MYSKKNLLRSFRIGLIGFIFFISTMSQAATYYFDATNGKDSNDGLTQGSAKQTLIGYNSLSLSPGDSVLFKRGETFIGSTQKKHKSGTSVNYITFDAYGTGAKPIITSVKHFPMTFTNTGNNIWKTTQTAYVNRLMENGTEIIRSSYLDTLTENGFGVDGVWYYDDANDELYVTAASDPSGNTYSFSDASITMYLVEMNYYNVNNLDIRGGSTSVSFSVAGCDYVNLTNCEFGGMGFKGVATGDWGGTQSYHIVFDNCIIDSQYPKAITGNSSHLISNRGAFDGYLTSQNAHGTILKNSIIKNWQHTQLGVRGDEDKIFNNEVTSNTSYGAGITIYGAVRSMEIHHNYIHDMEGKSQVEGQGVHFHHNVIENIKASTLKAPYNNGQGIWLQAVGGGEVKNNIFENNTIINCEGAGIGMWPDKYHITNNIFKNNIIYNCGTKVSNVGIYIVDDADNTIHSNTYSNNLVYSGTNTNTIKFYTKKVFMTTEEFNDHPSLPNGNVAKNNIPSDPLFTTIGDEKYHLSNGSPAIGLGAYPSTSDEEEVHIKTGTLWKIVPSTNELLRTN